MKEARSSLLIKVYRYYSIIYDSKKYKLSRVAKADQKLHEDAVDGGISKRQEETLGTDGYTCSILTVVIVSQNTSIFTL